MVCPGIACSKTRLDASTDFDTTLTTGGWHLWSVSWLSPQSMYFVSSCCEVCWDRETETALKLHSASIDALFFPAVVCLNLDHGGRRSRLIVSMADYHATSHHSIACQHGMPQDSYKRDLISDAQVELSFKPQIRSEDSLQWTQSY